MLCVAAKVVICCYTEPLSTVNVAYGMNVTEAKPARATEIRSKIKTVAAGGRLGITERADD